MTTNPTPASDIPATLRLAELHMKTSRALAAHFSQLAKAWHAHGYPEEAVRFLWGFEDGLTRESATDVTRPMTLRQRLEHRSHWGEALGHEAFVDVALLWHEFGRPKDAERCMKKAEAATVSLGRGDSVVWGIVNPCLRGWLAMGRPGDGMEFLNDLQQKFRPEMNVDAWVSLAKLRCMFPTMPMAAQCLQTAEDRATNAREFLVVADGWLACLRVEDAIRCAREAEKRGCDGWHGGWSEIAKFWRNMGFKEDATRCAVLSEEAEWKEAQG